MATCESAAMDAAYFEKWEDPKAVCDEEATVEIGGYNLCAACNTGLQVYLEMRLARLKIMKAELSTEDNRLLCFIVGINIGGLAMNTIVSGLYGVATYGLSLMAGLVLWSVVDKALSDSDNKFRDLAEKSVNSRLADIKWSPKHV